MRECLPHLYSICPASTPLAVQKSRLELMSAPHFSSDTDRLCHQVDQIEGKILPITILRRLCPFLSPCFPQLLTRTHAGTVSLREEWGK